MLGKSTLEMLRKNFDVEIKNNKMSINCDAETAKMIARNTGLKYVGTIGQMSLLTK